MTREEYKLKGVLIALSTLALPFIGAAAFFIEPLKVIAPLLFYGGPLVLLATFIFVKYRERKIPWQEYRCPYCGDTFQARPGEGKAKHLLCGNEMYLKDGNILTPGEEHLDGQGY